MKIGIYPGSFDPIHLGHIKIVNKIIEEKLVDKVLIVPTDDYWTKNITASLQDRINMAKLFESNNVLVETKDNQIKATYEFLQAKKNDYPNVELYLILGGDNIENIEQWINFDNLIKYPFIIVGRGEFNKDYIIDKFTKLDKKNYKILDVENIEISSTDIRKSINSKTIKEGLLDSRVLDYIVSNNLYI